MSSRFSQFLPESISGPRPDVDVADLVEESVAVFDLNLMVSAWNTEAERLYGWRRDEVIGGKIQAAVRCAPSESLAVILPRCASRASGAESLSVPRSPAPRWSSMRNGRFAGMRTVILSISSRPRETSLRCGGARKPSRGCAISTRTCFRHRGLILGVGIFRGRAAAAGSQGIGRRRFRSLLRAES